MRSTCGGLVIGCVLLCCAGPSRGSGLPGLIEDFESFSATIGDGGGGTTIDGAAALTALGWTGIGPGVMGPVIAENFAGRGDGNVIFNVGDNNVETHSFTVGDYVGWTWWGDAIAGTTGRTLEVLRSSDDALLFSRTSFIRSAVVGGSPVFIDTSVVPGTDVYLRLINGNTSGALQPTTFDDLHTWDKGTLLNPDFDTTPFSGAGNYDNFASVTGWDGRAIGVNPREAVIQGNDGTLGGDAPGWFLKAAGERSGDSADAPTGRVESSEFDITMNRITFDLAGNARNGSSIDLVRVSDNAVVRSVVPGPDPGPGDPDVQGLGKALNGVGGLGALTPVTLDVNNLIGGGLLLGDANNTGTVTADDLIAVQQNFGNVGPIGDGTDLGDANDNGAVTADDLIAVQQNFGDVLAPSMFFFRVTDLDDGGSTASEAWLGIDEIAFTTAEGPVAAVPEPVALMTLVTVGGPLVLRRHATRAEAQS